MRTLKIHDKSVALILGKDDALFLLRALTSRYIYCGKAYERLLERLETAIEEVK